MKPAVKFANGWFIINLIVDLFMIPLNKEGLTEFRKSWRELDSNGRLLLVGIIAVILPFIWLFGLVAAMIYVGLKKPFEKKSLILKRSATKCH